MRQQIPLKMIIRVRTGYTGTSKDPAPSNSFNFQPIIMVSQPPQIIAAKSIIPRIYVEQSMVRLILSDTTLKINTVLIIARRLIEDGNSRNNMPTIELATISWVPANGALNASLPIMSHK